MTAYNWLDLKIFFYSAMHIPSLAMYLYSRLVAFCGANTLLVAPGVDWVDHQKQSQFFCLALTFIYNMS